ncbi:MAG: hypothetical protein J2P36_18635 [Ktedonobacteraceae bacterium]|nr:hypothetical protein [Ktedonobacteraceae bacterium]
MGSKHGGKSLGFPHRRFHLHWYRPECGTSEQVFRHQVGGKHSDGQVGETLLADDQRNRETPPSYRAQVRQPA